MSQPPMDPMGFAMPADPRFDPNDPLVSADFTGWWQRGTQIVRRGWRTLALVQVFALVPALALLIPGQLYTELATRDLQQDAAAGGTLDPWPLLTASGVLVAALALVCLIYSAATLACARIVVEVAAGREITAGRALRSVLPRLAALIGWSLLGGLLAVAALLACVLPLFYVVAVLVVLPVVVLFEPGNGIGRCFQLFHTDLGAAISRIATIAALAVGLSVISGTLSTVVTLATHGSLVPDPSAVVSTGAVIADSVIGTILAELITAVIGVLLTPLIVATYADLRARREPFITAYLPSA